ncbi:MAG: hypothetical protein LIP06_05620 [Tannerellaceae bacterium]|nr:hypothetical protein [Tannerellaceae bacterium]
MSTYIIDKSKVIASLSYFLGIKNFRFRNEKTVLEIITRWTDEFIEKHKEEQFETYYHCHYALCEFARRKINSHTTEAYYKCPRCKCPHIIWQSDFVSQIKCPECHYIFDEDKSYDLLKYQFSIECRTDFNAEPAGLHIRTNKNPYRLAYKALYRLLGEYEKDLGTLKHPSGYMCVPLLRNDKGIYVNGLGPGATKTLAQALFDRNPVYSTDDTIIVKYNHNVLYVNLTETGWKEYHPYYYPKVIGNCV